MVKKLESSCCGLYFAKNCKASCGHVVAYTGELSLLERVVSGWCLFSKFSFFWTQLSRISSAELIEITCLFLVRLDEIIYMYNSLDLRIFEVIGLHFNLLGYFLLCFLPIMMDFY